MIYLKVSVTWQPLNNVLDVHGKVDVSGFLDQRFEPTRFFFQNAGLNKGDRAVKTSVSAEI